MGCDIHLFVEKKESGKWCFVPSSEDSWFDERYDHVFAILAGCHNHKNVKPISEPKGFPADISDEVRDEYESWDWDAHHTSFLTIREIDSAQVDLGAFEPVMKALRQLGKPEDVRVVFWFDN